MCAVCSPSAGMDCSILQADLKEETSRCVVRECLGGGKCDLCACCKERWNKAAHGRWAQHGLCPLPGFCHPPPLDLSMNTSSGLGLCPEVVGMVVRVVLMPKQR